MTSAGAGAFEHRALAKTCNSGGKTYACPEAFTTANALEATLFDEVSVQGIFRGPDYDAERVNTSYILLFVSSTWTAKVTYWKCAYAGVHSAEGVHSALGESDDGYLTYGPHYEIDFHVRHYCDCGGDIP